MGAVSGRRPRVLLVGQGAPALGGIPTFIDGLLHDDDLAGAVHFTFRNTTHDSTRPGGATLGNLRWTLLDAGGVFRGGRRADIVHLHLAPAPLLPLMRAIALVSAARLAGARTLVHAHSGRLHIVARSRVYRAALRVLALLADRIAVVSDDGVHTIADVGGRAVLVTNSIDTASFPEPRREPGTTSIVFVGTVCERKGLDDLRRALLRLRDAGALPADSVRVTIVGDGRQEGPGAFERVRDAYGADGLEPQVRFTGALPPQEVRTILATADIFCLPSHWEGLPLSLLEAMAAGAAVVATNVGDVPEVLEGGRAGIVVASHRPDLLANALGRLLDDSNERARLGAAARRRVRERYDRAATTSRVLAIYRELYSM